MIKRILNSLAILGIASSFALPIAIYAQEATPDAEPAPVEVSAPTDAEQDFLTDVLNSVWMLVLIPVNAPLVFAGTQILKRFFAQFDARLIALTLAVVLWLAYMGIVRLGYGAQYESLVPVLTDLLTALFGLSATAAAAGGMYGALKGTPVVGYTRS